MNTIRMLVWACAVSAVTAVTPATASDQLDGTYLLDLDASDDLDEVMKELGLNVVMRTVVKHMKTRLTIDGSAERVVLTVKTPIRSQSQEVPTDRSVIEVEGGEFGSGSMIAYWSDDGSQLLMVSDTVMGEDRQIHSVTTRRLEDPNTLLQQFDITIDGGESRTIRRIFRREG